MQRTPLVLRPFDHLWKFQSTNFEAFFRYRRNRIESVIWIHFENLWFIRLRHFESLWNHIHWKGNVSQKNVFTVNQMQCSVHCWGIGFTPFEINTRTLTKSRQHQPQTERIWRTVNLEKKRVNFEKSITCLKGKNKYLELSLFSILHVLHRDQNYSVIANFNHNFCIFYILF